MKNLEKIKLIDTIAGVLQEKMTFSEIDSYFETYKIPTDHEPSYYSKKVYVKEILPSIDDDIIIEIANELEIENPGNSKFNNIEIRDANFWKPGYFKLFVSHLASFKSVISKLKLELEKYGISSFVAHEDIEPTKEWQDEIEKGLFTMEALCAVLMPGFNESKWTDQEIGVAIGRDVLIIPIRRELDPYGFIGKYQGFQALGKNIGQVAEAIFDIISIHPKTRNKLINNLVELFLLSNNFGEGYQKILVLKKIKNLHQDKVLQIHDRIIENKNLKNNKILIEFNFISKKFELNPIKLSDFEHKVSEDFDDLPF